MSKELEILLSNVDACRQRIEKLFYSLNKNRTIFPLSVETVGNLSDMQRKGYLAENKAPGNAL